MLYTTTARHVNPHRLLNNVGVKCSAYHIRSLVRLLTCQRKEPVKYGSLTLLRVAHKLLICTSICLYSTPEQVQ